VNEWLLRQEVERKVFPLGKTEQQSVIARLQKNPALIEQPHVHIFKKHISRYIHDLACRSAIRVATSVWEIWYNHMWFLYIVIGPDYYGLIRSTANENGFCWGSLLPSFVALASLPRSWFVQFTDPGFTSGWAYVCWTSSSSYKKCIDAIRYCIVTTWFRTATETEAECPRKSMVRCVHMSDMSIRFLGLFDTFWLPSKSLLHDYRIDCFVFEKRLLECRFGNVSHWIIELMNIHLH
jgi:hypothetical protein